ncbi:MAG: competence/damage-inducible protein A [Bacteroidetes bacterium]|nr:competence/damage-inducible protein A [Bacteroidota bacterium]
MILAEIITIGDELLIGQVVDTNSAWMGQKLNEIGVKVKQITSISDDKTHILTTLAEAKKRADIILITGGLGPTKDDITKKTLCDYFNSELIFHEPSFKIIAEIFQSRGRVISETNRLQAFVPANCTVLLNKNGTAPGMWFTDEKAIYVSMPGVPNEMKFLMESEVIPRLKEKYSLAPIVHKTILTQGIGESFLSDLIEKWELALPPYMKLAYLPSAGMVRLRITASGENENSLRIEVEKQTEELQKLIPDFIYGFEGDQLESQIGELLIKKGKTLSTAESCTGGFIAHKITSVAGSSKYYIGSIIPYSNDLKTGLLNVNPELIKKHGAVSSEVVTEMAQLVRKKLNTDFSIATSGIAGPTGGSDEKPVGTVWIAISSEKRTFSWKVQLGSNRLRIISETALHALNGLRKELITHE